MASKEFLSKTNENKINCTLLRKFNNEIYSKIIRIDRNNTHVTIRHQFPTISPECGTSTVRKKQQHRNKDRKSAVKSVLAERQTDRQR